MMKQHGTKYVYEAHDMEKRMETICCGDYSEKCTLCEHYKGQKVRNDFICPKKVQKKKNIQNGCLKVVEFCRELGLPVKTLTWDTDEKGRWKENIKGIDDYLFSLPQKN